MPWPSYTAFAGENSWGEFFAVLAGLFSSREEEGSVARFEKAFADHTRRAHARAFASGRMALYAILKAEGVGPGDEVVLQAFTCNVVPRAICAAGATPVYADIDPVTLNVDIESLRHALTERTRAVIVQHTFGIPPDADGVRAALAGRDVVVIEDCAHAFRALPGSALGNQRGYAFFSTDHTKPFNTHVGGIACCDGEPEAGRLAAVADGTTRLGRLQRLRMRLSFLGEFLTHRPALYPVLRFALAPLVRSGLFFVWPDRHAISGSGRHSGLFAMTEFQARLGLSQLGRSAAIEAHHAAAFAILERRFGHYGTSERHPLLRYALTVPDRKAFHARLGGGLARSVWFDAPVSGGPEHYADTFYEPGSCPVAEWVCEHIVNITISSKVPLPVFEKAPADDAGPCRIDRSRLAAGAARA